MNDTNEFEIKQHLRRWRNELIAAAGVLRGEPLEEFKSVIAEVANKLGLQVTETGRFVKP